MDCTFSFFLNNIKELDYVHFWLLEGSAFLIIVVQGLVSEPSRDDLYSLPLLSILSIEYLSSLDRMNPVRVLLSLSCEEESSGDDYSSSIICFLVLTYSRMLSNFMFSNAIAESGLLSVMEGFPFPPPIAV